jgi:hypothetical protein
VSFLPSLRKAEGKGRHSFRQVWVIRADDRLAHSRFALKADVKHESSACATHEQTIAKQQANVRAGGSLPDARSLSDFDELERQGFLREQALTGQNQGAPKPLSGAMREKLGREDTLGLHDRQGRPAG